ncbi:E3 ubiquitin-protein ligase RNF170-like [Chenopodium quinoa]|uniref:E3 ubiquitin-protein ligase RNF170-like n=1 Tax=Chenopodium quinoa TaxID=63459 RepID=UPI000B77AB16|nr:E3 ubiquitin-protein ligase RNF170-like [Chenopodium quinoa]
MEGDGPPVNDCCTICHDNFNIPCQANCSHWFCGGCILRVWDHASALRPCLCPLCRRPISLLIPTESSREQRANPEVANIIGRIELYNRQYGERSSDFMQRLRDLPFLLRRLLRDLMDPQRSLPFIIRARIYLAVFCSAIYVLSPVDIIPEGVLGIIGLVDDLILVLTCFLHVAALYRSVLVFRHGTHGG